MERKDESGVRLRRPFALEDVSGLVSSALRLEDEALQRLSGCVERRGPYSGVIYESLARRGRGYCLELMGKEDLEGTKDRRGKYWKRRQVEEAYGEYLRTLAREVGDEGVFHEAEDLGLLREPMDFLAGDLFKELHRITLTGDTLLRDLVRKHHKSPLEKKPRYLKRLRAALIAGADVEGALDLSIRLDDDDCLRTLLEFGAFIEDDEENLPHLTAVESRAPRAFRVLCAYSFENNNLHKVAAKRNAGGLTALHVAVVEDSLDILDIALSYKAFRRQHILDARTAPQKARYEDDSNRRKQSSYYSMQQSAVNKACRYGHLECLRKLLEAGASPDVLDANGKAATHLSCEYGFYQCLELLLTFKADPDLKDPLGRSPRDYVLLATTGRQAAKKKKKKLPFFSYFTPNISTKAIANHDECLRILDENKGLPPLEQPSFLRSLFFPKTPPAPVVVQEVRIAPTNDDIAPPKMCAFFDNAAFYTCADCLHGNEKKKKKIAKPKTTVLEPPAPVSSETVVAPEKNNNRRHSNTSKSTVMV